MVIVEPIRIGYTQFNLYFVNSCRKTKALVKKKTLIAIKPENTGDKNQDITIPPTPPT